MVLTVSTIIHVVFVVLWMGGVAFVTMVLFPVIRKGRQPLEGVLLFQRIEHRYARIARFYTAIVGISGFVNLYHLGGLELLSPAYNPGLTIMFVVWVMWTVLLFGLEPLVIKRLLKEAQVGNVDIHVLFKRMNILHWVLLTLSLLAIIGGVTFAH